jgi:hypothetical protein
MTEVAEHISAAIGKTVRYVDVDPNPRTRARGEGLAERLGRVADARGMRDRLNG